MLEIVIAFIIVLYILLVYYSRSLDKSLLCGFWKASLDYCESADLDLFILYISKKTTMLGSILGGNYGYMLIKNSDGIILNCPLIIYFSSWNMWPYLTNKVNYNTTIEWVTEKSDQPDENVFPSKLSAEFYPKYGKLVLYKNDTIQAILYKDCHLSSMDCENLLLPSSTVVDEKNISSTEESPVDDSSEVI